jgi:hypothetical protein
MNHVNPVDPVQALFVYNASFPLAFYRNQIWSCFLSNLGHNDAQLYKSPKPFTSDTQELSSYHGKTPQILPALLLTGAKRFCWEKRPYPFTLIRRYIL